MTYNNQERPMFEGNGFARPRPMIFKWICCFPIGVEVDYMRDYPMVQNTTTILGVSSWNLPYAGASIDTATFPKPRRMYFGKHYWWECVGRGRGS